MVRTKLFEEEDGLREPSESVPLVVVVEEEEGEEGNKQEAWQRFCEKNLTGLNAQAMIKIVSSQ